MYLDKLRNIVCTKAGSDAETKIKRKKDNVRAEHFQTCFFPSVLFPYNNTGSLQNPPT